MKKITNLLFIVSFLCCLCLSGCANNQENKDVSISNHNQEITTNSQNTIELQTDNSDSIMKIHYIDIGQGDSTLIECDEHYALIDAGDNDKGSELATYLHYLGINNLDLVIGTHPDSDHIGGLDVIIYQFNCHNVWLSNYQSNTRTYEDVINTCFNKNYTIQYPTSMEAFQLGTATIKVLSNTAMDSSNNSSMVLLIEHQGNKFLFTGDSEVEKENMLLNQMQDVDVYHVGHHGSKTSSSDAFLDKIMPEYAVISCGEGNDYGHPHSSTLNKLREKNIAMYRTDDQGTIILTSNKDGFYFNTSPSENWTPGECEQSSEIISETSSELISTVDQIIGNINSKKYHTTNCGSLPQEQNRIYFSSEEEAVAAEYILCRNCASQN